MWKVREGLARSRWGGCRSDSKLCCRAHRALLSAGYDSMGYEMSKPDLRAELEADLKLICEGKKDKSVVLRQQIQKYRTVFTEAVAKAKK